MVAAVLASIALGFSASPFLQRPSVVTPRAPPAVAKVAVQQFISDLEFLGPVRWPEASPLFTQPSFCHLHSEMKHCHNHSLTNAVPLRRRRPWRHPRGNRRLRIPPHKRQGPCHC